MGAVLIGDGSWFAGDPRIDSSGALTIDSSWLDSATAAEYEAAADATARATVVVAALSGTVVAEVYDGTGTLRASGTMAAPWATASGATITVGELNGAGLTVTSGGVPDASWYAQFRSGARFVRGGFGVAGSGRDFTWSLATFATGSRGTLGTVIMVVPGVPELLVAPTLTGPAQVGQALGGDNGTWIGSPTSYAYKWQQSATGTGGWADISGATSAAYVAVLGDSGKYLRRGVLASNVTGSATAYAFSATSGQVAAAESAPLVQATDLVYQGAFRLPSSNDDWAYGGGRGMAIDPATGRMFITGGNTTGNRKVGEFTIPALKNPSDFSGSRSAKWSYLNEAVAVQSATAATSTTWTGDERLEGCLVYNGKLILTGALAYSGATPIVTHISRSRTLASATGYQVAKIGAAVPAGDATADWSNPRNWSGYMCHIPAEWQGALGGPCLTGFVAQSIVNNASDGPSAMVFNPDAINGTTPLSNTALVGYPYTSGGLRPLDGGDPGVTVARDLYFPLWNWRGIVGGCCIPNGTRTLLFVGSNGHGKFSYGTGTTDRSLHGLSTGAPPAIYNYDPASNSQGEHSYPYKYQMWAYDVNELSAVKAGTKLAKDVKPYAYWTFTLPLEGNNTYDWDADTPNPDPLPDNHEINGACYDPATRRLYVSTSHPGAPGGGHPTIEVFLVNNAVVS